VKSFVENGGTVFHGPHCELAKRAFGIREEEIPFDCIHWDEEVIPHGWSTVAYGGGTPLGRYIQSGKGGIVRFDAGKGSVYSFGFQYGHSYCRSTMPIVPPQYGKLEMHPVVLMEETPVEAFAGISPAAPMKPVKGVEFARFGKNLVIVNHRSSPVEIAGIGASRAIHQIPTAPGWLAAHAAVFLQLES
jgi:hypothetical protein